MTEQVCCHLCDKPGWRHLAAPHGQKFPICVEHYIALQGVENERERLRLDETRAQMAMLNHAVAEFDAVTGFGTSPRVTIPAPMPANNYSAIHVTDSVVGVINTATVGQITANIGAMDKGTPAKDALAELTAAVLKDGTLKDDAKNALLDQISIVAEQAAAIPKARKPAVVSALLGAIGQTAGTVTALAGAWTAVEPILKAHFGLP